jgi:hypothetical protein
VSLLAGAVIGAGAGVLGGGAAGLELVVAALGAWVGGGLGVLCGLAVDGLLHARAGAHETAAGERAAPELPAAPADEQPGWYDDPGGGGRRYWDGARWTPHTWRVRG